MSTPLIWTDEEFDRYWKETQEDCCDSCIGCSGNIAPYFKHCIWCGAENPKFDERVLISRFQITLAEACAEMNCANEHQGIPPLSKEHDGWSFCSGCGKKELTD